MTAASLAVFTTHARDAIAIAVRLHGRQRGWHLAATALGVSDRTARAIDAGETSGSTIPADRAFAARMAFRRQRAAQIRAELATLEDDMHDTCVGDRCGGVGLAR
jgi:hypothetical protein